MESTPTIASKVRTQVRKKTLKRLPLKPLAKLYDGNNDGLSHESIPILYEIYTKYAPLLKIAQPFRNFYHIGSGSGKLVIGLAYMNSTLKSTGIETTPESIKDGNIALEKVKYEQVKRRIELLCISPLNESVKYNNACWIYLSEVQNKDSVVEKLANEVKKGCIIICASQITNPEFQELNYITVESKVFVYTRV